jgi:hypothetical protein
LIAILAGEGALPGVTSVGDLSITIRSTNMTNHSKLAIALAIVIGTGSAGLAATKHPVHHKVPVQSEQLSGASAYGAVVRPGTVSGYTQIGPREPTYMAIQTQGALNGD